jgi:hypothetical protein
MAGTIVLESFSVGDRDRVRKAQEQRAKTAVHLSIARCSFTVRCPCLSAIQALTPAAGSE